MKKNAGKAPSVQFYYKDFLADMSEYDPEIVGAWLLVLIKIWHSKNSGSITKTLPQYAKIMNTDQPDAKRILMYFDSENIADVTVDNDKITVVNRRTKRDAKLLEQNRLRQQRFRDERRSNADVAPPEANPSFSSSSSSSNNIHTQAVETFTLEECQNIGSTIGLLNEEIESFFHHYNAQGWVRANGQQIVNLGSALTKWRNDQHKHSKSQNGKQSGKPKLFPIAGKTCSTAGCCLPAVYKNTAGAYDHYSCLGHSPKAVQEKYCE